MNRDELPPLDTLFQELLESLCKEDGEREDTSETIETVEARREHLLQSVLLRLQMASDQEIEKALHLLWRLMRHVDRELCWETLPAVTRINPDLRTDIRDHLESLQKSHPEETEFASEDTDSVNHSVESVRNPSGSAETLNLVSTWAVPEEVKNLGQDLVEKLLADSEHFHSEYFLYHCCPN